MTNLVFYWIAPLIAIFTGAFVAYRQNMQVKTNSLDLSNRVDRIIELMDRLDADAEVAEMPERPKESEHLVAAAIEETEGAVSVISQTQFGGKVRFHDRNLLTQALHDVYLQAWGAPLQGFRDKILSETKWREIESRPHSFDAQFYPYEIWHRVKHAQTEPLRYSIEINRVLDAIETEFHLKTGSQRYELTSSIYDENVETLLDCGEAQNVSVGYGPPIVH